MFKLKFSKIITKFCTIYNIVGTTHLKIHGLANVAWDQNKHYHHYLVFLLSEVIPYPHLIPNSNAINTQSYAKFHIQSTLVQSILAFSKKQPSI